MGPGGAPPPPPGGGFTPPPGGFTPPPGGGFTPPPGPPPPGAPPPFFGPARPPPGGPRGSAREWAPMAAMSYAWDTVLRDYGNIGLPLAAATFVNAAVNGIFTGLQEATRDTLLALVVPPLQLVVSLVVNAFLLGGIWNFSLQVLRGRAPAFNEVFSGGRFFVPMLVAHAVFSFAVTIGTVACIVPGIVVGLGAGFYGFLVVDRGMAPIDALKESFELTRGHKMNLFVLGILILLLGLAGVLACCVGWLLISAPVSAIAITFVYLKLIGEEPVAPARSVASA